MLEAALGWLSVVGLFVVGLIARILLAVLVIAAIVLPIAGLLYAWRGVSALANRLTGLQRLGHILWRRDCYYTPRHLWLKPAGTSTVRVGLDDVAQRCLPDVDAIHLPVEGTRVAQGDWIGLIQCAAGAISLRAPFGGTIRSVNDQLTRVPSLLHRDPYRRAWMLELTADAAEYKRFATGEVARKWLASEDQRLTAFFEQQLGVAAADGGELILPPQKLLTAEQWQSIRAEFLEDGEGCLN